MFFVTLDQRLSARVWWLTAAVLLTLLTILDVTAGSASTTEWIGNFALCFGLLGLWGLGLRRRILRRRIWQCLFVVNTGILIVSAFTNQIKIQECAPLLVVAYVAVIFVPYCAGMYLYGFRSDDIWRGQSPPKAFFARLASVFVLVPSAVPILFSVYYAMTPATRHFRIHEVMDRLCDELREYEYAKGSLPATLDNLPSAHERNADIRKFFYFRLPEGGFWLGYYEKNGFQITLTSRKGTNDGQPPGASSGASSHN
jgi:hypothetical protein